MQRRPDIEARFVVARLLSTPRGGNGCRGRGDGRGEADEVRFDGDIARGELPLIDVKEFEVLLERKEVFRAIVARQVRIPAKLNADSGEAERRFWASRTLVGA